MLPSNPHVKEVYTGNNGILSSVKKGSLLLDSSTIDPAVSRQVGEQCQAKGASYLDCPVSGGDYLYKKKNVITLIIVLLISPFPLNSKYKIRR